MTAIQQTDVFLIRISERCLPYASITIKKGRFSENGNRPFFMDVFWQKEDAFDCLSCLLRFDASLQVRVRRNGNG